jgi:serine/threonine-protein kinase
MSVNASPTVPSYSADESLPASFVAEISSRYILDHEIGRGGAAIVWSAMRRVDAHPVAIKLLRPVLAQAVGSQRFLREIRIASAVTSSALVPLEESGEIDGLPYYVMPLAEGGSLRDRLKTERSLRIPDAIAITRTIAQALAALHAAGFVHRDIKPENVLLGANGDARLADYGIAHAVTAAAKDDLTSTGVVLGTPPYMSPEQASGDVLDGRSDIYSLGCLLYEMLAGETPFHGVNSQAVLARHMHENPPSLRVVRSAVPDALEEFVMRMLAKVPADRFDNANEVIAALDALGDSARVTAAPHHARHQWKVRAAVAASLVLCGAGGIAYWSSLDAARLDPDRVIVFPFAAQNGANDASVSQVPMLVGSALDRTATTKWVDGFSLLSEAERRTAFPLGEDRANALARRARARYYIDGAIARVGDSNLVQLRLHDASTGLLLVSKTESARERPIGELALRALVGTLPKLTGLDSMVDVSSLTSHDPAAVDNWLRGERSYRQSRWPEALRYLELAVAADSLLAPAACRAAAAASWISKPELALTYIRLALRHADALSSRQRPFAFALESFLSGRADQAIERLRPDLQRETETADAWMLAAEVQLHLIPTVGVDSQTRRALPPPTTWPYESFVQRALERAQILDPGFTPPLAHLAEIAARRGDVQAMSRYVKQLERTNSDSVLASRMAIMERCLRDGTDQVNWKELGARRTSVLYHVGFVLHAASSPRSRACATAALTAQLAANNAQAAEDWGSLVLLHGMRAAEGHTARAMQLVDSAVAGGLRPAVGLYVLDAAAGIDVGARADAFVAQLLNNIATRPAPSLWLLTIWSARRADTTNLVRIHAMLQERTAQSGKRLDSLMWRVSAAYLARARGDTTLALRLFGALTPSAGQGEVERSLWEPLATERFAYAQLLLGHGEAAEAHRVASTFDHPGVIIHELFLRPSLELRLRAARALGNPALERQAAERIRMLETIP